MRRRRRWHTASPPQAWAAPPASSSKALSTESRSRTGTISPPPLGELFSQPLPPKREVPALQGGSGLEGAPQQGRASLLPRQPSPFPSGAGWEGRHSSSRLPWQGGCHIHGRESRCTGPEKCARPRAGSWGPSPFPASFWGRGHGGNLFWACGAIGVLSGRPLGGPRLWPALLCAFQAPGPQHTQQPPPRRRRRRAQPPPPPVEQAGGREGRRERRMFAG